MPHQLRREMRRGICICHTEDIGEGFLRLSVGLEDPEDLIADLEQALES